MDSDEHQEDEVQDPDAVRDLYYEALLECFRPDAPTDDEQLFHGRAEQRTALLTCVHQAGAHAIVFGERGAGKTSLARVVRSQLRSEPSLSVLETTCEAGDTFTTVWHQLFAQVHSTQRRPGRGFASSVDRRITTSLDLALPESPNAADICKAAEMAGLHIVALIDEFDVLSEQESARFAGLMKISADRRVQLTIVLLGVAENIGTLLRTHESVERCLHQIHIPRMSTADVRAILETGWKEAGFDYDQEAVELLVGIASGLPYYAHLLGQETGFEAADRAALHITSQLARAGARRAAKKTQYTIATAYREACERTNAPTLDQLAALAPDQFGYIDPAGVCGPDQLTQLCDARVLTREGGTNRYRFRNPLLQPYVLLQRGYHDE
jgi:Cdc6-like AAA superfamily ATPase